jgi:hypothetical protein
MPPVEVAAARWPQASRATAPTVRDPARQRGQPLLLGALGGDEVLRRRLFQRQLAREAIGAVADQQYVLGAVHHRARQTDRMRRRLRGSHCASRARAPVHDRGVEFGDAVGIQHRAAAGVEQREVLEVAHCRLDHVERTRARLQSRPGCFGDTRQRRAKHRLALRRQRTAIDDTGTAVDGEATAGEVGFSHAFRPVRCVNRLKSDGRKVRKVEKKGRKGEPKSPSIQSGFPLRPSRPLCVLCVLCVQNYSSR